MGSTRLHIGVDARELLGQPTGAGRYLGEILRAWSRNPGIAHEFTLFVPGRIEPELARLLGDRFACATDPHGRPGTFWEQTRLPGLAARKGIDVLLSPGYTAPLRLFCPSVQVVHDVSFFAHPEWFRWREGVRRRWLTRASARRARTVVTISRFSASEIQRWLGVPQNRIRIVQPGSPSVQPRAQTSGRPTVLFVGSLFNRRRVPELIQAFARVLERVPEAELVLVSDNRTSPHQDPLALAERAGVRNRVQWRAYAHDAELTNLYQSARVFVFLSDYEGFAMTPLEALAHGVPSVLLDTPVAREVYGDAARYTPLDVDGIAAALTDLLLDEPRRERLVAEGRQLLERYTWDGAASKMLAALEG